MSDNKDNNLSYLVQREDLLRKIFDELMLQSTNMNQDSNIRFACSRREKITTIQLSYGQNTVIFKSTGVDYEVTLVSLATFFLLNDNVNEITLTDNGLSLVNKSKSSDVIEYNTIFIDFGDVNSKEITDSLKLTLAYLWSEKVISDIYIDMADNEYIMSAYLYGNNIIETIEVQPKVKELAVSEAVVDIADYALEDVINLYVTYGLDKQKEKSNTIDSNGTSLS